MIVSISPMVHASPAISPEDVHSPPARPSIPLPLLLLALFGGLAALAAFGTLKAFPIFDDAWLNLLLQQQGTGSIPKAVADRPVFAWILQALTGSGSALPYRYGAFNILMWAVFCWQASLLCKRLLPDHRQYATVAAFLMAVPVVVQAHLCTITIAVSSTLATVLAFAGFLLLSSFVTGSRTLAAGLGLGALLVAAGTMVSEYGVCVTVVGCALLAGLYLANEDAALRKRAILSTGAMLAAAGASYLLYLSTSDPSARTDVRPDMKGSFPESFFNVATGTWRAVAGAYGNVIGQVTFDWDSKSQIAAIVVGLLAGLALREVFRASGHHSDARYAGVPGWVLLGAVALGLLPVALMGRNTALPGTGSRLIMPIQPVAILFTLFVLSSIAKRAAAPAVVAGLGFIGTYAAVSDAFRAMQFQREMAAVGKVIRPLVAANPGLTGVVVTAYSPDNELTGKIAYGWDKETTDKLWVMRPPDGEKYLGPREKCVAAPELRLNQRGLLRSAAFSRTLWVQTGKGAPVVQPYCVDLRAQP